MKSKMTSFLTASALIATAGVFYYSNASRHAEGVVSATASHSKSDLRDTPNSANMPDHKRNRAHASITVAQESQGDAAPQEIAQNVSALADSQLESLANVIYQGALEHEQGAANLVRQSYPQNETITKTAILDGSPSFNTVGKVTVSGPMPLGSFIKKGTARLAMDRAATDPTSVAMEANLQRVLDALRAFSNTDGYAFYTAHFVNDEDGDNLDGVIVDKANNQTLGFTF